MEEEDERVRLRDTESQKSRRICWRSTIGSAAVL